MARPLLKVVRMQVLALLVVGALVGAAGKYLFTERMPERTLISAIIGATGALIGYVFVRELGWRASSDLAAALAPMLGAMALVCGCRVVAFPRV